MDDVLLRAKKIQILDGGNSTEIAFTHGHGYIDDDPLWSARLLQTNPEVIQKVHKSFLEAGSDVIETMTYQASVPGFKAHLGVTEEEALQLITKGAELAVQCRDEFWRENNKSHVDVTCRQSQCPIVAGSVGPYGAYLADGSEYNGKYIDSLSEETLREFYTPAVQALVEGGVDLLAFDTIPSAKEASMIANIIETCAPTTPAWISFSCQDGARVCHGESFRDAALRLLSRRQVFGVGINCTAPQHVTPLLQSLPKEVKEEKTIVVYPNSGEEWTDDKKWFRKEGENAMHLPACVQGWCSLGARWIGGCCRVTPGQITDIRQALCQPQNNTS